MKTIKVKAKTRSKVEKVTALDDTTLEVSVRAPPVDGQANERIIELLSKHLGVPKSSISLVGGFKSKLKTFKIEAL